MGFQIRRRVWNSGFEPNSGLRARKWKGRPINGGSPSGLLLALVATATITQQRLQTLSLLLTAFESSQLSIFASFFFPMFSTFHWGHRGKLTKIKMHLENLQARNFPHQNIVLANWDALIDFDLFKCFKVKCLMEDRSEKCWTGPEKIWRQGYY